MRKQLLIAAALVLVSAPVCAQENDGTTAASQPTPYTSTTIIPPFRAGSNATPETQTKSVRDMTPEERRAYWENLSPEARQRVIERRRAMQAEQARQDKWKNLSVTPPAQREGEAAGSFADDPNLSQEQRDSMARGKAQWDAMTPEQKRAFITTYQAQIEAATQARQSGGMNR